MDGRLHETRTLHGFHGVGPYVCTLQHERSRQGDSHMRPSKASGFRVIDGQKWEVLARLLLPVPIWPARAFGEGLHYSPLSGIRSRH